jgi:hypothetical protein
MSRISGGASALVERMLKGLIQERAGEVGFGGLNNHLDGGS